VLLLEIFFFWGGGGQAGETDDMVIQCNPITFVCGT